MADNKMYKKLTELKHKYYVTGQWRTAKAFYHGQQFPAIFIVLLFDLH